MIMNGATAAVWATCASISPQKDYKKTVQMALDVIIRTCRPDECDIILELWRAAESTPSVSDSIDALKRHLQEDDDLLLVAEYDNRLVGTVMGGWDGWRGNIYRLAVLPEYRRQGIGRALVQEVERRLALKGAQKVSILVEKEEILAVIFWNALKDIGYEPDDRLIRYAKSL